MPDVSKFNVLGKIVNIKDSFARTKITEIINTITKYHTDKYIFIGDSYGDGLTPDGNVNGWCTLVPRYMGLSSDNYLSNPIGGSGFTVGKTFQTLLSECVGRIDSETVKYIVVCGGANDSDTPPNNIDLAIENFCNYAKEHFPNATVMIGCIGNSTNATKREAILNYVRPAYKQCGKYGAVYLSNVEYILHDYELMSRDTLHPTRYGYEVLSQSLVTAIKGSLTVFNKLKAIEVKERGAGITEITGMPNAIQSNNIVQLIGGVMYINTVPFNLNGSTGLKVCSIEPNSYVLGSQFLYVTSFECIGYVKHSDNSFESCPFMCFFINGEFWIEQRETDGFGFKNFTDVVNVTLFVPSITLNADYC